MERRKSRGKSMKRLSSVKNRNKIARDLETSTLPIPVFEIEDVLLTQLQVSDVMQNCIEEESSSSWSLDKGNHHSSMQKSKRNLVHHTCYNDTTLTPLWQAFASLEDRRSSGQVLLGRLMNLSSSLSIIVGEEHHSSLAIQQQFIELSKVSFERYKKYVLDTTKHRDIDAKQLGAICWAHCKLKYLNNPLVDNLDSVVPMEMCDALYYLFCIFNILTEPGTYPPSMDYEETEFFLRKLLACLGLPWTSTHEEALFNEDLEKEEEYEPSPPLLVNFQQLLSIIADMVGVETARSNQFYKATQRLCLMEYQEVVKSGWLMKRKTGSEAWRRRWGVLRGSTLFCYDTMLCQVVKEEIQLHSNMHVESLPSISSHRNRFRVVEKEGFTIICEHEFSCPDSKASHSWISLVNVAIQIHKAGITAKTAEICERRMERFKRRESVREVYRKKHDVQETYQRLQEAKKRRMEIEQRLQKRAQQREEQMDYLAKMDKIYERLESIQLQRRLHNKEEREKKLMKLFGEYDENATLEKTMDVTWTKEAGGLKPLRELKLEETQLESELKVLKDKPILLTSPVVSVQPTSYDNPIITLNRAKRSTTLDRSYHDTCSSEETSNSSNDVAMKSIQDVAF